MPPVLLIEGQFQDGTPHSCGMSVCQSAILHHQYLKANRSRLAFLFLQFLYEPRGSTQFCLCSLGILLWLGLPFFFPVRFLYALCS